MLPSSGFSVAHCDAVGTSNLIRPHLIVRVRTLACFYWFRYDVLFTGFERSPRSVASRTLTCFWMAFVTLTLTFYTASFFSLISVPQPESLSTAQTIEEIIASPDMEYGCTKDGFMERYLMSGDGPMFDQVSQSTINLSRIDTRLSNNNKEL